MAPEGARLLIACTPSGPEICFDAIDNNCNGVIDEGCGIHTGPLQFAIAWPPGSDVDLNVTDPKGELAKPGDRTALGLAKDRDCGAQESACHGQNMENVYFVGDRPPPGRYRVEVRLEKINNGRLPVRVRLGGRLGSRTFSIELELTAQDDQKTFAFSLE